MTTGDKIFCSAAPVNTEALKQALCMSHQIMNIRKDHKITVTTMQQKRGNSYGKWKVTFKQANLVALANNKQYFQDMAKNVMV